MWDEDFLEKKFQLGRVIEREASSVSKDLGNLTIDEQEKVNRKNN